MPKEIIIPTRKMIDKVKELDGCFLGKMQLIQIKMKIIADATHGFTPPIVENDGSLREWQE